MESLGMKHGQHRLSALFLMGLTLLGGCAQVSSPTGGPMDETPPQVLEMTPPNETVNLHLESLTLEFDEYVISKNVAQQLLISPPIAGRPLFKTRGKEVQVEFDPNWFDSETTYVLSFGDALVDLHESNPAEALFFAFSTGNELDTLTLEGWVVDHRTGDGVPGLRALFYSESTPWDSIWGGERPKAIAITNEAGQFTGAYLAAGRYKAIAIEDVNRDYVWNPGEALAFSTASIGAGQAWSSPWLFAPTTPPSLPAYIVSASIDSTGYSRILAPKEEGQNEEDWAILLEDEALETQWCRAGDSVYLWTEAPKLVENAVVTWSRLEGTDSLPARLQRSAMGKSLSMLPQWPAKTTKKEERIWRFDRVLQHVDASLWTLHIDSVKRLLVPEELSISDVADGGNSVQIRTSEISAQRYAVHILPGGVTSREGRVNQDTLSWKWSTWPEDHFGSLTLEVSELPGPGWLSCVPKGPVDMETPRIRCELDTLLRWPQLHPGKYEVGFEFDANNDSIWQSMDPLMQQTPEPYFYLPDELDIRSNWEMEWKWTLQSEVEELE